MKRKIICMMLSLAVVFSFMPFFTLQADAFSTGATTLVKTRTVTIQPGKTYKFPVVKLSKKKAFQVPVNIKVSKKSKKSQISKGGYILKIKNSKGKLVSSYQTSLKYVGKYDDQSYTDWIYFYKKSIAKPCFDKGKYYFSIKNTSNCAIRVKYSVKGYTKFASNADFVEDMTVDYNNDTDFKYIYMLPYKYVGRIGPGIPAISSITSSNEAVYADGWFLTHDGKLYLYLDTDEREADTVISVKLRNNKTPYKINAKVIGYYYEEEDDEPIDDVNTAPAE